MFALGFQEIVPLTAQQIVQTDPEKKYALECPHSMTLVLIACRRVWEAKIIDTLERRPHKKSSYILLRSHQVRSHCILHMSTFIDHSSSSWAQRSSFSSRRSSLP